MTTSHGDKKQGEDSNREEPELNHMIEKGK